MRRLPDCREQKNANPEWQKLKVLLGSCFNFSCEGNVLLDDANISYIEESPEVKSEGSHSGMVSEFPCSESAVCGDDSGRGVVSCITSPEIHSSKYVTQECSPIEWETNKLFPDIKKQSCKNYNSFDASPPIEGIVDPREASRWPACLRAAGDELRPLISKHNTLCYKNTEGAGNEQDCFAKKDRFYNKVLPFPIVPKSFVSQEYSGAVNSLVKFDDDTNSHSVSLNYGTDCKGNNHSVLQKPIVARDTMILCNDLDSDCQVVPLSFSPNVHPDVGSVPLTNCQVSMNNSVPPGTLVSSSCNSNSLVTLLNQTKDSIQPASWPRRRPQSLRVAMCYSDPEHLQATSTENPSSVGNLQEIALADMTGSSHVEGSSLTSAVTSTNVLSSDVDPKNRTAQEEKNRETQEEEDRGTQEEENRLTQEEENRGTEEEKNRLTEEEKNRCIQEKNRKTEEEAKTERPLSKIVGNIEKPPLENKGVAGQAKPDSATITNTSYRDSILKPSDISNEPTLMSLAAAETVLKSSALLYPLLHAAQNYTGGFDDGSLRSPSSDKENDPAMLSVRPKVKSIGSSHSPKRKKTSPLRKNRSPRRQRSDSIKEAHPKSLLPTTYERRRSANVCVVDDDVWAVDDFLPVSKSSKTQSIVETRSFSVKVSPTSAVKNLVSGVETKTPSKSDLIKDGTTPFLDDVDLSMVNSTFSTDTGYETETNTNSVSTEDCMALRDEVTKAKEVVSPHPVTRGNSVMDGMSFLPCVPSPHTTPINISGTTTPNTVTEDLTDYYSICSELANLVSVSNNIYQKDGGDDTADYLSISSELPGVFKLPEDSPCGDLNTLKPGFVDEADSTDPTSRLPTHEQPSPTNEESLAAVDDPEIEDVHEDVSSDQSRSNSSLPSPVDTPSQELVEVKYVQLSLSIVLAIVLHAMQSISQFMLEIFLATEQEDRWD